MVVIILENNKESIKEGDCITIHIESMEESAGHVIINAKHLGPVVPVSGVLEEALKSKECKSAMPCSSIKRSINL